MKKVISYVHSLKDEKTGENHTAEVEIVEHRDNNNVIAIYNGVRCYAIFNPFVGMYYVDDVFGVLS